MKINKFSSIVASLMLAGAIALSACEVPVDVKPTSCPNPVNVDRKGVLPVALLGFDGWHGNVEEHDNIQKIILFEDTGHLSNGSQNWGDPKFFATAKRHNFEDVAEPTPDDMPKCDLSNKKASCWTEGPDGRYDLTAKFDTAEVIEKINESRDYEGKSHVQDGELVCVTVMALITEDDGGTHRHHGTDVIWIKKKGKK